METERYNNKSPKKKKKLKIASYRNFKNTKDSGV